jgi:hypothetical protein
VSRRRGGTVAVAALLVGLSGCSFLMVERLEGGYRRERLPRCSATVTPVLADIGMMLYGTVSMAIFLDNIQWVEPEPEDHVYRREAIIWGTLAGTNAVSMVYGLWQRRRCGRARDAHWEWVAERSTPVVVPAGPPSGPPSGPVEEQGP